MVTPIITVFEDTVFEFALKGSSPIKNVTSSCGCTTSKVDNDIAIIKVKLDTVKDKVSSLSYKLGKNYYSKSISVTIAYENDPADVFGCVLNVVENADK